jgi:hypothetical protein
LPGLRRIAADRLARLGDEKTDIEQLPQLPVALDRDAHILVHAVDRHERSRTDGQRAKHGECQADDHAAAEGGVDGHATQQKEDSPRQT